MSRVRTAPQVAEGLLLALILVAGGPGQVAAALPKVTGITANEGPDEIRVAIITTGPVRYQLRNIRPDWVVVDLLGAELATPPPSVPEARGVLKKVRVGQYDHTIVRIVVELTQSVRINLTTSHDSTALIVTISSGLQAEHPQPWPETVQARIEPIVPGQRIGPVRLGMNIQGVTAVLGSSTNTDSLPNGSVNYLWRKPPENSSLGVQATEGGVVSRIWVRGGGRYAINEQLHMGSTEAGIRAALGDPSWVVTVEAQAKMKTLSYEALGVWFGIQLDERESFYNTVVEIGVMPATQAGHDLIANPLALAPAR